MHILRFIRNFINVRNALKTENFSTKELHTIALQSCVEYEKLYLQEQAQVLQEENLRAKMQLDFLNAQATLQSTKAQVLNTLVQCQSMLKSLKDNAAINRANAMVSFLQVVGNATNSGGISAHSNNVIQTINLIGLDDEAKKLKDFLDKVSDELNDLQDLQKLQKCTHIYAPSLETLPNIPIRIYAFSTLENATNYFLLENGETHSGDTMLFKSQELGKHKIEFISQNAQKTEKSVIELQVSDESLRGLK
ncbi:Uncharacterised protein [Helicobacter cinaedi]|uniref:Uncharacterized protein n=2 Tax=Helicobacter cinaedi TaxID=213 RepID=A0A377JSV0_9HELI|nr:hypothetical protein [Helicobacter cinaedi]STP11049.1 Uncharacterised protein [Helicobacter cinaedi]